MRTYKTVNFFNTKAQAQRAIKNSASAKKSPKKYIIRKHPKRGTWDVVKVSYSKKRKSRRKTSAYNPFGFGI